MRSWISLACIGALGLVLLLGCKKSSGDNGGNTGDPCRELNCDDGNDCTADSCDSEAGRCVNDALPDGAFCELGYCEDVACEPIASTFPCSEAGIRSAIAAGGGPHGFDCGGANLISTTEEIVVDNDVILDGRDLTLNGQLDHRVISVAEGVEAELWRFRMVNGHWQEFPTEGEGDGGGCVWNAGTLTILNSTVSNCEALEACGPGSCSPSAGGGILNDGDLTVEFSTIEQNRTTGGGVGGVGAGAGGGISNEGTLTVENSVLFQNSGQLSAGGIANGRGPTLRGATMTVVNTTFSGNVSNPAGVNPGRGAGIVNEGTSTLISCTFSENNSMLGSAISNQRGTVTVSNSILDDECDGSVSSGGYNIESTGDTCDLGRSTDLANVTNADLAIMRPLNYGGPTMTHALEPDSIALDLIPDEDCVDQNELPLEIDQRGAPRPAGLACDVGAFELEE